MCSETITGMYFIVCPPSNRRVWGICEERVNQDKKLTK